MPANKRHGVDLRVLLGPGTVGSTTGFMGVATVAPGEAVKEHYHPYSEEFLYLVSGALTAVLDQEPQPLAAGQALYIPIDVRHRLVNESAEDAFIVFSLSPLAPRPELGHVSTEP